MQTFNVQQQPSLQQGNSQHTNYQAVNQALNIQQAPQLFNLKQEVPMNNQQVIPNVINVQQAAVVPVNSQQSTNLHTTTPQQAIIVQQSPPVQSLSTIQQQAYPVNLQPSQVNFQQASPQSFQQAVTQPVKVQQVAQQSVLPAANLQNQVAPQIGNVQKTTQTTVHSQSPPIVQTVSYQRPVQQHDSICVTQSNLQQPQTLQQIPMKQFDNQQQIPCNNMGGYQVISYRKPCQASEATPSLPIATSLSTLSSNPNPTIVAAVPATMTIPSSGTQTDQIYVLSPQNYLTSTSYSPRVVTDTLQSSISGPTIQVPIVTVPNSIPSTSCNFVKNNCNQQFETENWSWLQTIPDIGMLSDVQFPIASLLGQPTSSVQSALLSSILSSIQNPTNSPQYVISSNYPAQTIVSPQSSSSSKLSLKSLLPLLLNMLQEKYSNSGCQNCQCCNCCNCDCANKNVMQVNTEIKEPHATTEIPTEEDSEEVFPHEESEEIEVPIPRQRKKPNVNNNTIPNDSTEIDEVEDSSCKDDGIEHGDDLITEGRVCSYGGDCATGYAVPGPPIPPPVTVVVVKDEDPMEKILPILLLMMSR
ncbi:hypothetical protein RR48_10939 [Papilio machaon]|uniref:Uncharacterized protein n=1 Tax=Papilio machaon TaxID=76193 RepID=A0A194R923_PAPMA|nr:hypothetical protein RR48_10939 [Papilio machaon]